MARVYAYLHAVQIQMGHQVQYPVVMAVRKEMSIKWMQETIATAKAAPIEGVLNLD